MRKLRRLLAGLTVALAPAISAQLAPPVRSTVAPPAASNPPPVSRPVDPRSLKSPRHVMDSVILVNTGRGMGTGFLCSLGGTNYVVTNVHVLQNAARFDFQTVKQTKLTPKRLELANDRDLARVCVAEQDLPALTLGAECQIGDAVFVYGNSQGQRVVTELAGKVIGVGADRIEVDAPFVGGNSGSPLVSSDGLVVGVATYLTRLTAADWMAKDTRFNEPRRFGLRITPELRWVPVAPQQFLREAAVLADANTFLDDCADIVERLQQRKVAALESILVLADQSGPRYHDDQYPRQLKNYATQIQIGLDKLRQGFAFESGTVAGSFETAGRSFQHFNELPLRSLRDTRWSTEFHRSIAREYAAIYSKWNQ